MCVSPLRAGLDTYGIPVPSMEPGTQWAPAVGQNLNLGSREGPLPHPPLHGPGPLPSVQGQGKDSQSLPPDSLHPEEGVTLSSSFVVIGWHLDSHAGPRGRGLCCRRSLAAPEKAAGQAEYECACERRGTDEREPPGDWVERTHRGSRLLSAHRLSP